MRIIKKHGGLKASLRKIYLTDTLKWGELVGTDKYGNKYYTDSRYFFTRNRWVEFNPKYATNYDGSMIPPEWYGWMHHKTDYLPSEDPYRPKHKWIIDHVRNPSGTSNQYYPYSTTRPKITPWIPSNNEDCKCKT